MAQISQKEKRFTYMLITLFVILSAGIIAGSILFYRDQRDILTLNQTRELLSIAELKARQISDFRKERYSEANFLLGNHSFMAAVKTYHSNPQSKVNKDFLEDWLLPIQKNHNYESISIMDSSGSIFYQAGKYNPENSEHGKEVLGVLRENKIRFGDLHLHEKDSSVHLEVFVPLILTTSISVEKVGVVNFSINPHTGLFDLIQSWPVESRTGEVLLVKKEGDHVVFQNELRFMRNTALRLKFPVTDTRLPAAHAVQGETGVMTGMDYRGHEVMAAMKHIPDSDWYIVAKRDTERIYQPMTTKATLIFALMTVLLAAAGTAFFIVWRAEKMKKLKIEIQSVDAVKRLNRVYQVLSNVNQAIVRINDRGELLNEICRIAGDDGGFRLCWVGFVNEETGLIEPFSKAGAASSYLKYITVSTNGSIPAGQGPVAKAFQTGKPVVFNNIWTQFQLAPWKENAIKYRLRSAAAFPLKGSSGPIGAIGFYSDQFNFFTTHEIKLLEELSADLSYALLNIEREESSKISEQALLESEDRYRDLVENSLAIICSHDLDGKILSVNKRGVQLLDYAPDALLKMNIRDILIPDVRKEFDNYLAEIRLNGSARGTMVVQTAAGKKRVWEFYNTLRTEGVSAPIVRGTAQDITERKRAEVQSRIVEEKLRNIIEYSTNLFYSHTPDHILTYVSPQSRHFFDCEPEEAMIRWTEFVTDNPANQIGITATQRAIDTAQRQLPYELELKTKQGRIIWVEVFEAPVVSDGRTISMVGSLSDITERKRAEMALRESENIFKKLFEESTDPILLLDDTGFTDCNKAAVSILSYSSKEEFLNKKPWELSPEKQPDGRLSSEKAVAMIAQAAEKGFNRFEWIHIKSDGTEFPVEVMLTSIMIKGKQSFYTVWRDISERKRAEMELRESEMRYRSVSQSANDAIITIDSHEKVLNWNYGAEKIFGYTEAEIIEAGLAKIIPQRYGDQHIKGMKRVAQGGESRILGKTVELFGIHKNGKEFPIELSIAGWETPSGKCFTGIIRDISDRRNTEQALLLQSSALNAAANGIVITNSDGVIEWVNQAFYALTGYSSEEAVGKNPRDLVKSGVHDHAFYKHMWDTILDGKVWSGEITNRRKEGTLYIEEQSITPLKNEQGKIAHFIAVKQDITERKKAEEALRESNERFWLISRATNDAVWDWDITTDKTWWNDRFYSLFGFAHNDEHTSLKSWAEKIHPDDRERVLEHFRDALNGISQGWSDEFRYQLADGSYGFIYDRAFIIRDDNGKALRMIGSMIDMTLFKKSEQQLQQSENRLRAIVEAEPECVKTLASDGTLLSMNAAGLRMIGAESSDQVVGKPIYGLIAPEYAEAFKKLTQRVFEGRTDSLQFRLTSLTGVNRWLDTHAVPLRDEKGNITILLGVTRDITEQKKALEALRENEAKLKVILESTADGILAIDTKGAVIMANPRFFELWRIPDAIQKSGADQVLLDFVLEQLTDPEAFLSKVKMLYGSNDHSMDTLNFKDGRVFERLSAPLLSGTTSLGRLWSFRDISERKRSMEALLASEEKYKSFFDDDLTGDFISTPDGKLLACNPAFAKMFGYDTVDEALKMDVHSLYSDKKARENMLVRLKREKRLEYFTSELIRKDGKKIYVIENMMGTFNKKGELTEIKGYLFDDTRRRSLETQLIQAQKMESLGTLAGGIAHDFNNILAIIMGHTSLIRRKSGSDEHLIQNAETITKATQRGASLVKQLLTFARKTDAVLESILIQDTVNEIRRFIEQTFPKTITITTEFEKDLPPILADGTQIHQVLLNLTINARDAMPHGGALSITAHRITKTPRHDKFGKVSASEYIHVKVSDTGTGMDEETKNRIFEPFFTTKGRERGTGLGLATVYGIVESHHGFIDVESEIGKGSTFNLFFPIQQSFIQHEIDNGIVEEIPGGDETILVVDDEESMRYFLESILAEKGYHILSADDGQAALDLFTKHDKEIDLILTDLGLPKMNGEELVTGIIKTNPNVKIIVASGFFENKLKAALTKAGVKEFVQKPYSPDEILKKVREVLDLK